MRRGQGESARKYGRFFLKLATEGVEAQEELIAVILNKLPLCSDEELSWLINLLYELAPEETQEQLKELNKVQERNLPLVGTVLGGLLGLGGGPVGVAVGAWLGKK